MTKQELFSVVWPDTIVEDSNLSQKVYNLVAIHVALGDNAKALQQLEKASLSPLVVAFLKYDPQLDSLRSDSRFADFLHTQGLDQRFERAGE